MNKFKLFSAALMSLAFTGITKAQFDYIKPDDMDELHNRTLIVIVEGPADAVIEKLGKKKKSDKADSYKNAVDGFNKNFAAAIAKYWKITEGEIQYKTLDEVNDITDKKTYCVLFCRSASQKDLTNSYKTTHGLWWWPDFKEVAHDKDFSDKMTVMGFATLEKFDKSAPFYQFTVPDLFPTKADLDYSVNAANAYIMYRVNHRKDNPKKLDEQMLKENAQTLKDKTLLLRRDWLDKRLTPAEILKVYPYPYMIAGPDTVARAIDSADAKYAVAIVAPYDLGSAPSGGLQYVQFAYNLEDGSYLGSSGFPDMPSNPKAAASTANANKPLITKKTLLDFVQYLESDDDSGGKGKKKGKR